jgi:hypothetical protein
VTGTGNSISGSGNSVNVVFSPSFSGASTVSVSALGCGGPTSPVSTTVTVRPTGTWLAGSTNWNLAGNWCGGVPTPTTDVVIPTGSVNMPQINAASFANNVDLQSGTTLIVNGSNSITISGIFTKSGTFSPSATSTVIYNGSSAQNVIAANYGNITTSGTGTKTLVGNIGISGRFNPVASGHEAGTSTVDFNGSSAQDIPGFTFNNLTTSGNNAKSLTGNVIVGSQLNLSNGTLGIGANALTLNGTIAGSGSLTGTFSSTLNIGGSASSVGTLKFMAGSNTIGTFSIAKTAAGNVNLGNDLNISNNLDLTYGKVVIGQYNLTLLSGATTSNQNASSYVQTLDQVSPTGAGFFIREVANGAGERVFPVGTGLSYTPAYISNVGTTRSFKVRNFNNIYENGIAGGLILHLENSVKKTWEIEPMPGAGTPNVSIRLQWNLGDEGSEFSRIRQSDLAYIGKNSGIGNSLWIKQTTASTDYSASPFSMSTSGITTFSKFAVGSDEEPLPVLMSDLKVNSDKNQNHLIWESFSEVNGLVFEVLRSDNGIEYEKIGFVSAKGKLAGSSKYQYSDKRSTKEVFYKIRFVGTTECHFKYSNPVVVNPIWNTAFNFYPNPVIQNLTIENEFFESGENIEIKVSDLSGRMILNQSIQMTSGTVSVDFRNIPSGVYMVEGIRNGISTGKRKIIKI